MMQVLRIGSKAPVRLSRGSEEGTRGDGPNGAIFRTEPIRREQPTARCALSTWVGRVPRRSGRDRGPVRRPRFERQYRDRQVSRWLV